MTVVEGDLDKRTNRNCIMVAIQMDNDGRDLLNWAIGKFARTGDHVIAAHVCRRSDLSNSSIYQKIKSLDSYLSEFEPLCSSKQVTLVGRLAQGSSIKKAIVKEANFCSPTAVAVGVYKNTALWGGASLAKYCSKKLPTVVSLFAVHDRKVVYKRESTNLSPPPSEVKIRQGCSSMRTLSLDSATKISEPKKSCAPSVSMRYGMKEKPKQTKSLSIFTENQPEQTPGWPFQREIASVSSDLLGKKEVRKMSVVQWAMSLPDRSQPPTLRSVFKSDSTEEGKRSSVYSNQIKQLGLIFEKNSSSCQWFTRDELDASTNQFSSENLIGSGGCSKVYMGNLPDGHQIAVKVTKLSEETLNSFLLEADIITTVQHKNIVPVRGVCMEGDELMSVYNFFYKGSLEKNLHCKTETSGLSWDVRFKVALGIAEALCYLHNDCTRLVIHRDIKSSNILLTDDLEPQLSDFGIAIWAPEDLANMTYGDIVGTFGYLAPEYFTYGKVSDKMDTYSFGVVLLELLTGRKPICFKGPKNQESLVMWVRKALEQGDLMGILDPNLGNDFNEDQMRRMVLAAITCIRRIARLRPQMCQVLSLLRGEEETESWMVTHNITNPEEGINDQDEESYTPLNVASHLGLALQDVDDVNSISSTEQNYQGIIEEYLKGRWSRSSSFD